MFFYTPKIHSLSSNDNGILKLKWAYKERGIIFFQVYAFAYQKAMRGVKFDWKETLGKDGMDSMDE